MCGPVEHYTLIASIVETPFKALGKGRLYPCFKCGTVYWANEMDTVKRPIPLDVARSYIVGRLNGKRKSIPKEK